MCMWCAKGRTQFLEPSRDWELTKTPCLPLSVFAVQQPLLEIRISAESPPCLDEIESEAEPLLETSRPLCKIAYWG